MGKSLVTVPTIKEPIRPSPGFEGRGILAHRLSRLATVRAVVLAALASGPMRRGALAQQTGIAIPRLAVTLTKMKAAGIVQRVAPSVWAAVPVGEWPATRGKWSKPAPKGPANHAWRGGRYVNADGYVLVQIGRGAPMADCRGYAYEHRLVAAASEGRALASHELVHHRDETRDHNVAGNLKVCTLPWHKVEHRRVRFDRRLPDEANPTIACACGCGASFPKFDTWGRPRRFVSGHSRRRAA